jgi:DNA end-binding protein Ku
MARDEEQYEEPDAPSAGRAFWSGTITFGLVSVPVDLYPANRSQRVSLRMLDADGTPLRRRFYDPKTERPVDTDEIVRGFEMEDGSFVVVTDDELESLEPRKSRDIDLRTFVPADQVDPLYFERAYFLTPAGETNKAYRLLAEVMERTGRAGIATFVMRTKEYLVAILAENGILRAETLRFPDEVRSPADLDLAEVDADDAAVTRMQRALAKLRRKNLAESELRDTYAQRLLEVVEKKRRKGVDVVQAPAAVLDDDVDDSVIDLMEVLKRSMRAVEERESRGTTAKRGASQRARRARAASAPAKRAAKSGKRAARHPKNATGNGKLAKTRGARSDAAGRDGGKNLSVLSKAELYERAQALDIAGRSGMSKAELVRALKNA